LRPAKERICLRAEKGNFAVAHVLQLRTPKKRHHFYQRCESGIRANHSRISRKNTSDQTPIFIRFIARISPVPMGVGRGSVGPFPWILKISTKKGCFLSFEW